MLIQTLLALTVAVFADSVPVVLSIGPAEGAPGSVEWVQLDSTGLAVETGTTPALLHRDLAQGSFMICALELDMRISVHLSRVPDRRQSMAGESHCFKVGMVGKRYELRAIFDPRVRSLGNGSARPPR